MNKKLKLMLSLVFLCLVASVIYLVFYHPVKGVKKYNGVINQNIPLKTINYLVSSADTTQYCNGVDMDSIGYSKTITTQKSTTTSEIDITKIKTIKTILSAATTGMCNAVLEQLDIKEEGGVVYIPQIDAWAGVSIVMCSCKPQVEVNLLQIPGITKVVWLDAVNSFEDCVAAGNSVMESYPRQCRYGEKNYLEDIGNELEKTDIINLDTPRPNETITSPLSIKGQARGSWFFEASLPVFLIDWDGKIIAQGIAKAQSNWMTNDFVPFEATLTFAVEKDTYSNKGSLIIKKDNPSGLFENDDALEVPLIIK